jgi:hypothetical protein
MIEIVRLCSYSSNENITFTEPFRSVKGLVHTSDISQSAVASSETVKVGGDLRIQVVFFRRHHTTTLEGSVEKPQGCREVVNGGSRVLAELIDEAQTCVNIHLDGKGKVGGLGGRETVFQKAYYVAPIVVLETSLLGDSSKPLASGRSGKLLGDAFAEKLFEALKVEARVQRVTVSAPPTERTLRAVWVSRL